MIIANKQNQDEMLGLIPSMEANMDEWQIITAKTSNRSKDDQALTLQNLLVVYGEHDGLAFMVSDYKVIMVLRLGKILNYAALKAEIEEKISNQNCSIIARRMTPIGLKHLHSDIANNNNKEAEEPSLYELREERKENVILVADDDMFVRKSLVTLLSRHGRVVEVENATQVIPAYRDCNPDIVLLDIHMPGADGLSVVNNVIDVDTDAFIVMISSDSSKDNVLEAVSCGAVGFLSKPVRDSKLVDYITQCITIN